MFLFHVFVSEDTCAVTSVTAHFLADEKAAPSTEAQQMLLWNITNLLIFNFCVLCLQAENNFKNILVFKASILEHSQYCNKVMVIPNKGTSFVTVIPHKIP